MKTVDITTDEFRQIILKEESHFFDYKAKEIKPAKIEKIVVAFANADGGEVYIGIKDIKDEPDPIKRWDGFSIIEDMNSILQAISNLSPSIPFEYNLIKCSELSGYVLKVVVERSSSVHLASDGTVYIRQGAQSIPVKDPMKLTELSFAKGASTYEDYVLETTPPDIVVYSKASTDFLNQYSPATDSLEFFLNQNLIDSKYWSPRVAAIMLFCDNPQATMPRKCGAKVTRYETREDDPEREHLKDQHTLEGPLFNMIHQTIDTITSILSNTNVHTPSGLKKLEFPKEAIWEIVVNAFIHRDYSISDDVQILIYNNRIEVHSPGKLPGYVTTDNILDARYSRNPKIVRTLNRYPDPPNRDMGEGLNTAFQKMKDFGLKQPVVIQEGNYVKVTLPHIPLAPAADLILDYLQGNSAITNSQAREITGIKSENQVKNEFYRLRDQGLIERVPGLDGPKAAWRKK